MATETYAPRAPARRPRDEHLLAALAVLSLALIPVHITKIYSGLPAHPLFLHVPVILIPVVAMWAVVLVARPRLFSRSGILLGGLTVIALAATNLTMGAGSALRDALHLRGGAGGFGGASGPAALVARHAHAASILRLLLILFTAVLLAAVLGHRVADDNSRASGGGGIDRALSRAPARKTLRVALAVLAIACGYFVFHVGDLGAKAVWAGRLSNGGRGGGGFPGGPGPGSGSGSGSGGVAPTG